MPHLIRDVTERVLKNSVLSKVIRPETGECRRSSDLMHEKIESLRRAKLFDLEEENPKDSVRILQRRRSPEQNTEPR
jgi:hypothetical protein